MKRYRLDPKKPRQLTPEEQARLDKARIDYSDIPPLGDEFFSKAKQAWPPAKEQLTGNALSQEGRRTEPFAAVCENQEL
jgi:hypothetical protein